MMISGYVSVIVPVHQGALCIRRCLEAIAAQTYRPLEVVLVDDGSTDATPAWVRSFRAAHPELPVHVVTQDHAGVGAALAAGLERARGELVALAHQADAWAPEKLARQVAHMQGRPDADFVVSGVVEHVRGEHRRLAAPRLKNGLLCDAVPLSSLLARRRAIEAAGGFDASPGLAPTHDLACRLAQGGRGLRLDEPLATCHRTLEDDLAPATLLASVEKLARAGRLGAREARRGLAVVLARAGWRALFADEPAAAAGWFRRAIATDWRRLDGWAGLCCAGLDRLLFATGLLRPGSESSAARINTAP